MSDFKAKMHQIQFRLGEHSAPPDPLAGFKGPTSKGREGRGRKRGQEGKEGIGKKERRGRGKGEGGEGKGTWMGGKV